MKNDVPSLVMNKLFEQGFEDQIIDIALELENDSSHEISDIPLSPITISSNEEKVVLSEKVYETYRKIVTRINNPQTAPEVPFLLLGGNKIIDDEEYIVFEDIVFSNTNADSLKDTSVSIDEELFKNYVSSSDYDVISIGHTHGNVGEQIKNNSLARKLSSGVKDKYAIRDTGLNVSVSDIWQHEAFKQIASHLGNKRVMQTIIMYNGDIVVINDKNISKSSHVIAEKDNDMIDVSVFESEKSSKVVR